MLRSAPEQVGVYLAEQADAEMAVATLERRLAALPVVQRHAPPFTCPRA